MRIAQTLYQRERYADVRETIASIDIPSTALGRDSLLASASYYLGEAAYQLKDYKAAARELGAYVEAIGAADESVRKTLATQTDDASFKIAHALQLAGDTEASRKAYLIAARSSSDSVHREQILFELGQLAYGEKNSREAASYFKKVLADHPMSRFAAYAEFLPRCPGTRRGCVRRGHRSIPNDPSQAPDQPRSRRTPSTVWLSAYATPAAARKRQRRWLRFRKITRTMRACR